MDSATASEGDDEGEQKGTSAEEEAFSSLASASATDEDWGRMGERVSRDSRLVARQEPFPIDVIDTVFCPFFTSPLAPPSG